MLTSPLWPIPHNLARLRRSNPLNSAKQPRQHIHIPKHTVLPRPNIPTPPSSSTSSPRTLLPTKTAFAPPTNSRAPAQRGGTSGPRPAPLSPRHTTRFSTNSSPPYLIHRFPIGWLMYMHSPTKCTNQILGSTAQTYATDVCYGSRSWHSMPSTIPTSTQKLSKNICISFTQFSPASTPLTWTLPCIADACISLLRRTSMCTFPKVGMRIIVFRLSFITVAFSVSFKLSNASCVGCSTMNRCSSTSETYSLAFLDKQTTWRFFTWHTNRGGVVIFVCCWRTFQHSYCNPSGI